MHRDVNSPLDIIVQNMHCGVMTLEEFMRREGLSDRDMARLIGRSRATVTRYRRRTVAPPIVVIAKLLEMSGQAISVSELAPTGRQ